MRRYEQFNYLTDSNESLQEQTDEIFLEKIKEIKNLSKINKDTLYDAIYMARGRGRRTEMDQKKIDKKMNQKEIEKKMKLHMKWLRSGGKLGECADFRGYDLRDADFRDANFCGADLCGADLCGADLCGADLEFSCLPLWCGSLKVHIDDKQAKQLAYHLVSAGLYSKNTSEETKRELSKLVDFANGFHRVEECGRLEPYENEKIQKPEGQL